MRRIKVCHIITRLELGGAQGNTLHTVSHLDQKRFDPLLIAGAGGILDDEARSLAGVRVIFVPFLDRPVRPWKDLLAFFALCSVLRRERPDVVHTHSSKAGILGRWAARAAGVPVIVHTYHGFGFNDRQNPFVRFCFVAVEKLSAPITGRLIVVTREDEARGRSRGIGTPQQYQLIRSGIDVAAYRLAGTLRDGARRQLGLAPDARVVLTVGPFKPQKNLADFLRAARRVLDELPDTVFLMAGDGEQRPCLEALCREMNIAHAVRMLGWRRDMTALMAAADVFMMTSLWEGLPRSILEAMSAGLPVVANAVDGVREIVIDRVTGFLTMPGDIEFSARYTADLLNDPAHARALGTAGRERVGSEFDLATMVQLQESLYASLAKSRGAA